MSDENKTGDLMPERPEGEENSAEYRVESDGGSDPSTERTMFEESFGGSEPSELQAPMKQKKKISVGTFLVSCVALILAAVMVTYTCCNSVYKRKLAEAQITQSVEDEKYYPFELFDLMLESYSFEDLDEEEMIAAALKAYVYATGDDYAAYYTQEEYAALREAAEGESEGIGINVINDTQTISGVEYRVIRVINVSKGSPAEAAGMKVGDAIYGVGVGESMETVHSLDYDVALTKLQGTAGTVAEFTVYRSGAAAPFLPFSIPRQKITASSVYARQSDLDPSVGVVKIIQFDLTTPAQFCEAIEELKAKNCEKFVFDVRYNPGGDLASIEAVLSYFLNEGDVIIRTRDKAGNESVSLAEPRTYTGSYASCNISREEIGKYRELDCVVLCNGSTASAAELFTATFRDYQLAPIVGTTTFGKGSMQSIFSLAYYGYSGALKLTTALYYPASNRGYDGIGITPDHVVELSEAAASKNIYALTDGEDDQMQKALELLS